MPSYRKIQVAIGIVTVCSLLVCSTGWSQDDEGRRGGDRGGRFNRGPEGPGGLDRQGGFTRGRRGGGGGLLGEVQNEATRSEINLTEEQLEKIREIGESLGGRDQFGDVFSRMQAAESEEERNKIREELRSKMEETRAQAEEKMKSVLTEDQFKRLDQIRLHRDGTRALGREEIQSELGMSDDQKQKLEALAEERGEKFRELGFQASEEDREKLRQEFEQKTMSILTDDQKKKWQDRLGPPPADAGQPRPTFGGRPTVGGPTMRPREIRVEEVPEGASATMSFGDSANGGADATNGEENRGPAKLSFNFRYAPWTEVLKLFARESGLSLDLIDVPPGTFSYYDQKSYTSSEALDVLNGYLLPKGFVLVHRDDFLVSLNIDDPIPPNLIPKVQPEDLVNRGKNELLTVTFPIEGVDAAQVAAEINEVKGPQGKVVALPSSNSVLVTDIGSNLIDINIMLQDMIGRPGPDDMSFKPYQIKNLPVVEAEAILRSVLGVGSGVANVSAMNDSRSRSSSSSSSNRITIASDERTNKLLISTTTKTHQLIEQALETIDVEGEASSFSAAANKPFLRVYSVTSADAREVVKTIDALMPGIVVNEDGRNGKIHIMASPDKHAEVDNLIRQMDGMGSSTQQVSVIPLSTMDPLLAAATVRSMFVKDGELAPTVEADVFGRQLMIRGDANQLAQVKLLLAQLGEDGTGQRDRANDSRLRTFPLSGRDPEEIMPLIQRMWNQRSGSSIRIVNPDDRGPVRDVISPSDGSSVRDQPAVPSTPANNRPTTTRPKNEPQQKESVNNDLRERLKSFPLRTASQTTTIAQAPTDQIDETTQTEPSQPTPKPAPPENPLNYSDDQLMQLLDSYLEPSEPTAPNQGTASPNPLNKQPPADVNVTIMGDDLMLYATDPEALNQLEELLETAMQAIPPSTSWTVFTLQSADATEVSLMLEQLLPYSNVSSTASGGGMLGSLSGAASSLGSGIAEMTGLSSIASAGQSLRIIPDTRLNALFVSGPSGQVKEVEEMLRVLDASEWPDTLRDKVTRLISLEYADADDVLRMVKESYKIYIDPPQQQNSRNNPLAAMMGGGGRGGGRDDAVSQIKMTASVDSNTNQLIIWADDSLFQEVKSFVESVDEAARQARRTVRVISLQNTNSSTIKGVLGTLMPNVNVSSTASRQNNSTNNNNSNSNNNNSDSGRSNEEQERIRQFFEQRMRERMQGGGGNDSGGGRPSFGGGRPGGGGAFGGGRPGGSGRPGR